jgi:hypothetical protein
MCLYVLALHKNKWKPLLTSEAEYSQSTLAVLSPMDPPVHEQARRCSHPAPCKLCGEWAALTKSEILLLELASRSAPALKQSPCSAFSGGGQMRQKMLDFIRLV